MSIHRSNPKRDANERVVTEALEAFGFAVSPVSSAGIPDLIVSRRGGPFYLVEVKMPKGAPTPAQVRFKAKHTAQVHVIRTLDDAHNFSRSVQ